MAASDYDFTVTRNQTIERAYRIIGKLSPGESLSGEEIDQAIIALNSMVQSWQSENVFLWQLKTSTLSLSDTVASYSLAATDPLVFAIDRAYLSIDNHDEKVDILSFRQYQDIPTKTDPGDPTCIALDHQAAQTLYVYPVPTQARTLKYLGIVKLKDFDSASGGSDFPVRYAKALAFGLAAELAPEYGLPIAERRDIRDEAGFEFARARRGETEKEDYDFVRGAF